jgi:hypothetical protein
VISPVPKPEVIRSDDYQAFVRRLGCLICGQPAEPHHVLNRRGYGDARNLVPLCRLHHREGHDKGWRTWERRYGQKLKPIAVLLYEAWVKANDVEC